MLRQRHSISSKFFRKQKTATIDDAPAFDKFRVKTTAREARLESNSKATPKSSSRVLRSSIQKQQKRKSRGSETDDPYSKKVAVNTGTSSSADPAQKQYETNNVVWHETKVGHNRWLISVKGEMIGGTDSDDQTDPTGVFLLCGDQVATKIDNQLYEVAMLATKFDITSRKDGASCVDVKKKAHILGYLQAQFERKEQRERRKPKRPLKDSVDIATQLHQESTQVQKFVRGLHSSKHQNAPPRGSISTIRFFTQKGKKPFGQTSNASPRGSSYGPASGTQYHWFFLSEMRISKAGNGPSNAYKFELSSNKFQLSFGRPQLHQNPVNQGNNAQTSVEIKQEYIPVQPFKVEHDMQGTSSTQFKQETTSTNMKREAQGIQVKEEQQTVKQESDEPAMTSSMLQVPIKEEQQTIKEEGGADYNMTASTLETPIKQEYPPLFRVKNEVKPESTHGIPVQTSLAHSYASDMLASPLPTSEAWYNSIPSNLKFEHQPMNPVKLESNSMSIKQEIAAVDQQPIHSHEYGSGKYICAKYPIAKSSFINEVLKDMKIMDSEKNRLTLARVHFDEIKAKGVHYNQVKSFKDINGRIHSYTGMPVGGVHKWFYREAGLFETKL